ncbi:MAG: metallophosphoesterase [bacterium]
MNLVAISDLHLGSPHSKCRQFRSFLSNLPPNTVLVLNGDTVDVEGRRMPAEHHAALSAICAESLRRRVVWIWGNHDKNFVPDEPNSLELVPSFSVGKTFFAHGDRFMPISQVYLVFARFMRAYRKRRVTKSLGTIKLAQSLPMLFNMLKKRSMANSVRFAVRNGYHTVVCGHLHDVEDTTLRGIRYINTGTWTDWPAYYLSHNKGKMQLTRANDVQMEAEGFGGRGSGKITREA